MVALLLERGADPDAVALDGNLALHGAAASGSLETVRLLLPRTHAPALRNRAGETPRDLALARGYDAVAAELPQARGERRWR